ncbi:uncharacterized protein Z518_06356 [Rhinocladiella mackenziei CBS 650.93]|uniref:Heterokaryon incompatibility domain-containing protein n=1 Tax=Rhinocladiella mackenziei CBS 650.93 TaxID=1442369 RepID=A0A0D2IIB6_9EURO|nr:uncharacterized protein Z518_06356 [Rhinocladiella mackenziei CBS 650.93]KIX05484.1 hypothetical protein Z518_06356 [Rhinocladiella mackenziei CBS 650.93]
MGILNYVKRPGIFQRSKQLITARKEIQNPSPELKKTAGYKKVLRCCEQAASVGFDYVWIDTCCIDKTDKFELTEALNSMFHWYRQSQVCYSYLTDVPGNEDPRSPNSAFRRSRWFTRGWTLQELLAPLYVIFFSEDWTEIGTKASLQEVISEVTGISSQVLLTNYAGEISVAQRMAWASKRETAEVEDQAYCLMGLFGVNMPTMYGEGENAFQRLQLEIIKVSDDHSIFAWTGPGPERGLLARSPREFAHCGSVRRYGDDTLTSPFSMTNKGLNIKLPLIPCHNLEGDDVFLAVLNCQRKKEEHSKDRYPFGIYLRRLKGNRSNHYIRVKTERIEELKRQISFNETSDIYVRGMDPSRFDVVHWMQREDRYIFSIKKRPNGLPQVEYNKMARREVSKEEIRLTFGDSGHSGILIFKDKNGRILVIILGVHNYNVWCDIATGYDHEDVKTIAREYWDGVRSGARWAQPGQENCISSWWRVGLSCHQEGASLRPPSIFH